MKKRMIERKRACPKEGKGGTGGQSDYKKGGKQSQRRPAFLIIIKGRKSKCPYLSTTPTPASACPVRFPYVCPTDRPGPRLASPRLVLVVVGGVVPESAVLARRWLFQRRAERLDELHWVAQARIACTHTHTHTHTERERERQKERKR